ncbi:MAG: glutamate--cysteine ligase [Myxococcaceae bacterium]
MSLDLDASKSPPLSGIDELVAYFRSAERPVAGHKVGLEHEKFLYPAGATNPVPYEGPRGISAVLKELLPHGYTEFRETPSSPVIALTRGIETISLEPGGQFELSGSPFVTAAEAHAENLRHLLELRAAAQKLQLRIVALGYRPFDEIPKMPWMPKTRYRAMRDTLGRRGSMALDMMLMTSTGQVSLDWASEADCAEKVTLTARLTPLLVALYANSPLRFGKPSGYLSFRSHVWTDVDKARCGYLPSMIDGSFSYQKYVDWALDAPLLFLRRAGQYLEPQLTFRQLLKDGFEGKPATQSDWVDHLSTLFPEVRIKKVMEVRGADCNGAELTGALAALWRGLLYDPAARKDAADILPKLSFSDHLALHEAAQKEGLRAMLGGIPLWRYAKEMVEVSRRGLRRLSGDDAPLLDPLLQLCNGGVSPAERILRAYEQSPNAEAVLAAATI